MACSKPDEKSAKVENRWGPQTRLGLAVFSVASDGASASGKPGRDIVAKGLIKALTPRADQSLTQDAYTQSGNDP